MTHRPGRRNFLKATAAAGAGFWLGTSLQGRAAKSPNEKLDIAFVGIGGKGESNVGPMSDQNVVALCDVDEERAGKVFERHLKAKKYQDFRKMLDELKNNIDAVVVSTPDHTHFLPSMIAMQLGKHVYVEKPMAHSIWEVRQMTELAAKNKLVTQMGNQIHSEDSYRRVAELVQSGIIGNVKEAHGWCNKGFSATKRPAEKPEVPKTLQWDLWLGPAPERPYHKTYVPFNWRGWRDFGTGGGGDMACHVMDPIFWGLNLRTPVSVSTVGDAVPEEGYSPRYICTYEFEAREKLPPVIMKWYTGYSRPDVELPKGINVPSTGQLFVGDKGMLLSAHTSGLVALLPQEDFKDKKLPASFIPKSIGHHKEFVQACKGEGKTGCLFDYTGALTESVLLAHIGLMVGKKFKWDTKALKSPDCSAVQDHLRRDYRKGWTI